MPTILSLYVAVFFSFHQAYDRITSYKSGFPVWTLEERKESGSDGCAAGSDKAGVTAVRQVAISGSGERLSVALLENERLVEWRCEGEQTEVAVGEIFVGQVADVLPAIQSAFVQIGMERNAYLYVDDVREPTQHPGHKTTIRERVREGEKPKQRSANGCARERNCSCR